MQAASMCSSMASILGALTLILCSSISVVDANMYDVLERHKLPPVNCPHGCAQWASAGAGSLWRSGAPPPDAGSSCAQPGAAVNDHTLGAWCYCANATSTPSGVPPPGMPAVPASPAGAAGGGDVVFLENVTPEPAAQVGEWVSFTGNDVLLYPKTDTGGKVPWQLVPAGLYHDNRTFLLQNRWHCDSGESRCGMYMGFTGHNLELYPQQGDGQDKDRSSTSDPAAGLDTATDDANKVPWRLVPVSGAPGEGIYHLQNQWRCDQAEPRCGWWVGFNDTQMIIVDSATPEEQRAQWQIVPAPAPSTQLGYCTSALSVPEQINLQVAGTDSVVAAFVTFEPRAPTQPPVVMMRKTSGNATGTDVDWATVRGVTHERTTENGDRTIYMHFVRLANLTARATYEYKVRSGGVAAADSDVFEFRAPFSSGVTKIDIFGDMGIYQWNNLEWLLRDVRAGDADFIAHLGDHAYNEGDADERRADAYMAAYQPVLARVPWMPVVGNHEFSGTKLGRYLNATWEGWGAIQTGFGTAKHNLESTATSTLGAFLSTGIHHSAGTFGGAAAPSHTSRYFSSDVGLVHMVALDFNLYYGEDPCGEPCRVAQLEWLKSDLAAANANRAAQPWIVATAHFPVFCTGCAGNGAAAEAGAGNGVSAAYYASARAEYYGNCNATAAKEFDALAAAKGQRKAKSKSLGGASVELVNDIAPLLQAYGVDLMVAGHWHYYESLWPAVKGSGTCPACAQKLAENFVNPRGTVHITTGNGGPPGKDSFTEHCPGEDCGRIDATRAQSLEFGYGRLVAHNGTVMEFTQFYNSNGSALDHFVIVQERHGPFQL